MTIVIPSGIAGIMKREVASKAVWAIAISFLVFGIALSVMSFYPVKTNKTQTLAIVSSQLKLCPNETYRYGLGEFHGGENITVKVDCQTAFLKNFSIITYKGQLYSNVSKDNICYSFVASADYYETIFASQSSNTNWMNFQVNVTEEQTLYPFSLLAEPGKIIVILSLASTCLVILKLQKANLTKTLANSQNTHILNKTLHNRLFVLLTISLACWLVLEALNSNGLATFENWYTDHARHTYVSSLFIKDGFSIFSQPLGSLSNQDSSRYMFVTWPEMPHLYPLGSIFVFLPFAALLQSGFDSILVFKIEVAIFLVTAHICLYLFLKVFLKKDLHLTWKAVGLYVIYVSLVIYAADGMYDSLAFFFALIAVSLFLAEQYDKFFFVMGISVFLKYQAGIFLLPLILMSLVKLTKKNDHFALLKNKFILGGAVLGLTNLFTALLSAPLILKTRSQLIMNGINAFSPNAQIPWNLQAFSVILTLATTLVYSLYMRNKNCLLSLSSAFLLLPSFILPYFQNWYLPFIFVYILIPQQKKELEATLAWLIFVIIMLSFGGASFNPIQIIENFKTMMRI